MNIWHKRLLYLQCWLLLALLVVYAAFPQVAESSGVYIMFAFLLAEFGVLEAMRNENPNAVLYRKSCLVALVDLASVMWFITIMIFETIDYFVAGDLFSAKYYPVLFLYIILRKMWIMRHYSYEIN